MTKYSLLLSGGGTNGVVYVGVFRKLRELNISIKRLLGVSVGSICGLIYLLNYTDSEIYDMLINTDFNKFRGNIRLTSLIKNYGINSFSNIKEWIENLLIEKGIDSKITFDQFFKLNGVHFQVTASNINKCNLTVFDYQLTPNIKIVDAIKMSCCIPFVFIPTIYNGDFHVDGSVINNFPIELFEDDQPNVIGVKISDCKVKERIENIMDYSQNIINSLRLMRNNSLQLDRGIYTITIPGGNFLNFDINKTQKEELIKLGYDININLN